MMGEVALAARALADGARRDLASEWSGPEPAATQVAAPVAREAARRAVVRKP